MCSSKFFLTKFSIKTNENYGIDDAKTKKKAEMFYSKGKTVRMNTYLKQYKMYFQFKSTLNNKDEIVMSVPSLDKNYFDD